MSNLKYFNIPTSQDLVAQYLFLYSNSGDPGDFDSYVDNDYKRALVTAFVKTDSSLVLADLVKNVKCNSKRIKSHLNLNLNGLEKD